MQSKLMFWGQIWHLHHGHAHFIFMLGMHLCPAQRQCHHCGQKSHPTHAASSCSSSFLQLGQMLGFCCSVCKCTSVNSLTWKKNWIIYNHTFSLRFLSGTFPGHDFGFVWVCEIHNKKTDATTFYKAQYLSQSGWIFDSAHLQIFLQLKV